MTLPLPPFSRRSKSGSRDIHFSGFTLIELLCVITIIAILASLLMPAIGTMKQRADSVKCASNLRAIGVAVQCYLQDHSFIYPCIEPLPDSTVYSGIPSVTAYPCMGGTNGAFGAYGITPQTTQCPSDMKSPNCSYTLYGSSYDWRPTLDDESANEPIFYGHRFFTGTNGAIVAKLSRIRQVFDDNTGIHFGHVNALYADGHVVSYFGPTTTGH